MTRHTHRWSLRSDASSPAYFGCPCGETLPVTEYTTMLWQLTQQVAALRELAETFCKERLPDHSWYVCRACGAPWFAGQPVNHAPGCKVGRVLADSAGAAA